MKKPVFPHDETVFAISAILSVPLLIDICTACNLFSLWIAWMLFTLICLISIVRLVYGFKQKCYKFCWGLLAQLILGFAVLAFFQLSYNEIIETPVSHPVDPAVVNIAPPKVLNHDSISDRPIHPKKSSDKSDGSIKDDIKPKDPQKVH